MAHALVTILVAILAYFLIVAAGVPAIVGAVAAILVLLVGFAGYGPRRF